MIAHIFRIGKDNMLYPRVCNMPCGNTETQKEVKKIIEKNILIDWNEIGIYVTDKQNFNDKYKILFEI